MTVLWILIVSAVVLILGGRLYSGLIARWIGEDPSRRTPALERSDGVDYVPTPTPIVFAHHFASIAGAGPIIGPVLAIVFGWGPALLWVVLGGLLMGAVHDYLATFMATREGGQSVATIARNLIGRKAFVAFVLFLILMLSLVTAMFLNISATALTSTVELARLKLEAPGIFRSTVGGSKIIIGGIASMSVIVVTACAPLVGYLYIKKQVSVWICSMIALLICGLSILVGLYRPVSISPRLWQFALSAYVLVAAGAPVWLFLQSRDFINVHILYVGIAVLVVILVVGAVTGARMPEADETFVAQDMVLKRGVQSFMVADGQKIAKAPIWPMLFITVACGAVSGFHSLCAGGTTCKQLRNERATRQIGYYGMLLESFLAVCVISVLIIGLDMKPYLADVHPKVMDIMKAESNPVLGFAMAVGWAAHLALGAPIVVGALAGMILLEGFLVTTLDTAVRLMRYLIEELWRTALAEYDVFAPPVGSAEAQVRFSTGDAAPAGAEGIPIAPAAGESEPAPAFPTATTGAFRQLLKLLRHYWVNSGLAVGLMLLFALTGGAKALWAIFATANQLLAALVLLLAALWLLRQGRRRLFALLPAVFMLITTGASLLFLLRQYQSDLKRNMTLFVADVVLIVLTVFLLVEGIRATVRLVRRPSAAAS